MRDLRTQIPIFLSRPLELSPDQAATLRVTERLIRRVGCEPLTLRVSGDLQFPVREVYALARRCCGGVILGFSQYAMIAGFKKRGSAKEQEVGDEPILLPSPWNQIEAGLLFGLGLPLLIFREPSVEGGIFDVSGDLFILDMPVAKMTRKRREELSAVVTRWAAEVRTKYYDF